jgi:hypothetical protein
MLNAKQSRRTLTLLFAIAIGPALAGSAVAWFEGAVNRVSYLATAGHGCIEMFNHVVHGNGTSPMSMAPHLIPNGFEKLSSTFCKAVPGTTSLISGDAVTALLKLTTDRPDRDTYSVCQIGFTSSSNWVTELTATYSWSTPPCGPGFYAAVTCTTEVNTLVTDWADYVVGQFTTPSQVRNCHHARIWHPANSSNLSLTVNL